MEIRWQIPRDEPMPYESLLTSGFPDNPNKNKLPGTYVSTNYITSKFPVYLQYMYWRAEFVHTNK